MRRGMNFQEIADYWTKLEPCDPEDAGEAKCDLVRHLFESERGWSGACIEWLNGGPGPYGAEVGAALDSLLAWAEANYYCVEDPAGGRRSSEGYVTRAAHGYIRCARVAACVRDLQARGADQDTDAARSLLQASATAVAAVRPLQSCGPSGMQRSGMPALDSEAKQLQEAWQVAGSAAADPVGNAFQLLPERLTRDADPSVSFLRELTACLLAEAEASTAAAPRTYRREAVTKTVSAFFVTVPTLRMSSEKVGDRLFRFDIDGLPGGTGEVLIEPEQAFVPWDAEFRGTFRQARVAVEGLLKKEEHDRAASGRPADPPKHRGCDFRVRLLGGPHIDSLSGPSAGGALARALYFAVTGKIADDGIVVMAQISCGVLSGVGSIKEKVEVIARWNDANREYPERCFDTVVVASKKDRRDAIAALKGRTDIRVQPDESEL